MKHNPHIDWRTGSILQWSEHCHVVRLKSAVLPAFNTSSSNELSDLSGVPSEYSGLKEVFNKVQATSFPPHRPYDFAIYLLPGSSPPMGRLFSLSAPETKVMDEYINNSLELDFFLWIRRTNPSDPASITAV